MAAIAPEIPEMILFGMAAGVVIGFVIAEQYKDAITLAGMWFGAFAMYVKGK